MREKRLLHHSTVTRDGCGARPSARLNMRSRASKNYLTRSKQEVDACGVPKMISVGIVSSHETR
jgi:hypothetical protein